MRTLNKYNINIGDINIIEREKTICESFRNEDKNARATIYEIDKNKLYCLVVKQNGEHKKVLTAQNEMILTFRVPYIFRDLN